MSKPLYYGMLNPVTGKPFVYGDPNLFYGYYLEKGDPGYVPYPEELEAAKPGPKKKPFHRKAKPTDSNTTTTPTANTSTTMSTFQYNTAPNPKGGYTTRVVLGDPIVESTLTAAIAAAAGVTPAQAETVIKTLFAKLLEAASGCGWSPGLYGAFSMRPTSGGSEASPDMFHNADDINAYVNIALIAASIRDWKAGLSIESMGDTGLVTPVIDTIIDIATGTTDHYTPAGMIQLRGSDLKCKLSDLTQGTFFRSGNGPEVRATLYGQNDPGLVSVGVPAALSGPLIVRHAAFINGSVRSYTYTHSIV
jgi:hypothetical protein